MADKSQEIKKEEPGKAAEESKEALKMKKGDYSVHIFLEEARGLVPEQEG